MVNKAIEWYNLRPCKTNPDMIGVNMRGPKASQVNLTVEFKQVLEKIT